MTMVSIPAAIPLATGRSSPSLATSRVSHRRPVMSTLSTPPPTVGALDEPVPPTLDCALLASPGAANVLRSARLSLLHSLPSVGIAWSLWCGRCGALREGLGGAETPRTGGGCKRDSEGEIKCDDGEYVADELERELERTLAAMAEASDMKIAPMPVSARKPQRRRKNPRCTSCGTKFHRPKPAPPPYPPARAAVRTRRQSALAQCVKPDEPEEEKVDEDRALSPAGTVDASQLFGATTPTPPITRAPSLAHISTSDPATPTYPTPKAAPPPQPKGALCTTLPTSPPPAKKRKTKKSGLAKLLAQNAAREAEKAGSGNWGLG